MSATRVKRVRSSSVSAPSSSLISRSLKHYSICFSCASESLGRFIPVVGGQVKGSVLDSLSCSCPHNPGKFARPSFNRMSGIQEFSNGIALFLNIFGCNYTNSWREETINGDQMLTFRWFAQPSQSMESLVIQRILVLAQEQSERETRKQEKKDKKSKVKKESENHLSTRLLLYCRLLNEPYVFCGSLSYVTHEPLSRPLAFQFALNESKLQEIRQSEAFKLLMEAALATGRVELDHQVKQEQEDENNVKQEEESQQKHKRIRVKRE
jgi:hypothetical protein